MSLESAAAAPQSTPAPSTAQAASETPSVNLNTAVTFDDLDADAPEAGGTELHEDNPPKPKAEEGEAADPEKAALDQKAKEKVEAGKAAAKVAKFKTADGKAVEVPFDASFEVPVDGKPQNVSLAELRDNYAGKVNWAQKHEELATERKAYQADVEATDSAIANLMELAQGGRTREAIEYLYEVLGGDPKAGWENLTRQLQENFQKRATLTPEQRAALDAKDEADYYKRREETRKQTDAKRADESAVTQRIDKVCKEAGVDRAAFQKAAAEMKELGAKGFTPEDVGKFLAAARRQDSISSVLDRLGSAVQNTEKAASHLQSVWDSNPDLTEADIEEIAKEVYGKESARALSRRVRKDDAVNPATPPKKPPQKKSEAITFDDLE